MRVLFYLLDGDSNASSWHRALQFFPLLREHGIVPTASRPVPQPLYAALVERGRGMAHKMAFYSLFLERRLLDVLRANQFDVVVIQRDLFPFGPPLLERLLRRRNSRLVYDTDDATYLRPSFTPDTVFQRLRHFDKVAEVVCSARWVSVATEPIAAWARQHNSSVSVLPMAVDLSIYDRARQARQPSNTGSPVIGWAGTGGGLRYLEALAPVLQQVSQTRPIRVRVISGHHANVRLPGLSVERQPWRGGIDDIASFDIGLVPLANTPFEQAKFPFKLLQYLALGVPTIAARVGIAAEVIQDGENGILASSAPEWIDGLERLVGDPRLRARLAANGRDTVAQSYTLERIGPLLAEGLRTAARGRG